MTKFIMMIALVVLLGFALLGCVPNKEISDTTNCTNTASELDNQSETCFTEDTEQHFLNDADLGKSTEPFEKPENSTFSSITSPTANTNGSQDNASVEETNAPSGELKESTTPSETTSSDNSASNDNPFSGGDF